MHFESRVLINSPRPDRLDLHLRQCSAVLGEYDGSGSLIQETVWLGDIPVATVTRNGSSVAIYYVETDQLDTPRQVIRPSDNAVMWRWFSGPFGSDAPNTNPQGAGAFTYDLRFPGQIAGAWGSTYQNSFRDYDPAVGRYVESDPIGLKGGINTYAYAGDNPSNFFDPSGLTPPDRTAPSLIPPGPFDFPLNPSQWSHDTALALQDWLDKSRTELPLCVIKWTARSGLSYSTSITRAWYSSSREGEMSKRKSSSMIKW